MQFSNSQNDFWFDSNSMHRNAKVAKMDKIILNSIPIPMHQNNTDPYQKKF